MAPATTAELVGTSEEEGAGPPMDMGRIVPLFEAAFWYPLRPRMPGMSVRRSMQNQRQDRYEAHLDSPSCETE